MFALLAVEEFLLSCSLIQYGNYICRFLLILPRSVFSVNVLKNFKLLRCQCYCYLSSSSVPIALPNAIARVSFNLMLA